MIIIMSLCQRKKPHSKMRKPENKTQLLIYFCPRINSLHLRRLLYGSYYCVHTVNDACQKNEHMTMNWAIQKQTHHSSHGSPLELCTRILFLKVHYGELALMQNFSLEETVTNCIFSHKEPRIKMIA